MGRRARDSPGRPGPRGDFCTNLSARKRCEHLNVLLKLALLCVHYRGKGAEASPGEYAAATFLRFLGAVEHLTGAFLKLKVE